MDRRAGYTAHPLWRRGSGYFSFWDAFPDTRTLHSVLFSYAGRGRYQTPIRCWRLSRCASDPEMYDCVVPVWSGLIYRNYSRLRKFTAASYQIFQLFPNLFYQKEKCQKKTEPVPYYDGKWGMECIHFSVPVLMGVLLWIGGFY